MTFFLCFLCAECGCSKGACLLPDYVFVLVEVDMFGMVSQLPVTAQSGCETLHGTILTRNRVIHSDFSLALLL